jgi:hypothetical protein
MGEIAGLAFAFSAAGLLAGLLIGWLGNRWVLLACLGLAVVAAAVLGIQAALNNGWGRIGQILYSVLTLWGAALALAVSSGITALRARRSGRAPGIKDCQP